MAKSLYKAGMAAGRLGGSYKASMYDVASKDQMSALSQQSHAIESQQFDKTIGSISSAISLASTAASRFEKASSDISTLEGEYGKMQTEGDDSIFKKMIRGAKLAGGVGEYKFGEGEGAKTIAAKDFGLESQKIETQNMWNEWNQNQKKPVVNEVNTDQGQGNQNTQESNIVNTAKGVVDKAKGLSSGFLKRIKHYQQKNLNPSDIKGWTEDIAKQFGWTGSSWSKNNTQETEQGQTVSDHTSQIRQQVY